MFHPGIADDLIELNRARMEMLEEFAEDVALAQLFDGRDLVSKDSMNPFEYLGSADKVAFVHHSHGTHLQMNNFI